MLRVQDDDRKTSRLACFLIEFAGDRLGVGQQQHRPRRLAYAVDEVLLSRSTEPKAGVSADEQTVGDFGDVDRVTVIVVEDANQLGRRCEIVLLVEKLFSVDQEKSWDGQSGWRHHTGEIGVARAGR